MSHKCDKDEVIDGLQKQIDDLKVWHKIIEIVFTPKMILALSLGSSFIINALKGGY